MFSVSFNPPEGALVSDEQFYAAFDMVEKKLGLSGQPRAIVAHEKEGRRHFHVVWSRIDTNEFKAINLSHFKLKCMDVSKQLYLQHGWDMPQGLIDHKEKQTVNLKTAEYAQLKRQDVDPEELRQNCIDAWAISDNLHSFKYALEERNLFLAKGDKRGFVVLDHNSKVYSLSRFSGIKVKELKSKLGLPEQLASVDETKERIAATVNKSMRDEILVLKKTHRKEMLPILDKKAFLVHVQRAERRELSDHQRVKRNLVMKRGKDKYRRGLKRLFDKVTGKERRIRLVNKKESGHLKRAQQESRQMMIFRHNQERFALQKELKKIRIEQRQQRMSLAKQISAIRKSERPEQQLAVRPSFDVMARPSVLSVTEIATIDQPFPKKRRRSKVSKRQKWRRKIRPASRLEAKLLKRKQKSLRLVQFLRRKKQKPEYKTHFNQVNGEVKSQQELKRPLRREQQFMTPKMD